MSFAVAASAYDAFMGRFSGPLSRALVERLPIGPGQRAVDVGCGPGALTSLLVERLGAASVAAVDPSTSFVEALGSRLPGVDVRRGGAESLPWPDASFDLATANLVVNFMADPVAGLREMARVTRGGTVAATLWNLAPEHGPLGFFFAAVHDLDPQGPHEDHLPGARPGQLVQLFRDAGLADVTEEAVDLSVGFPSLEEWWHPFTLGVGPAGVYVASLDEAHREALMRRCGERLGVTGDGPVDVPVRARLVTARA
ncbi:class I SAM-dependent methyltransferase [Nocardioides marmoribigeumensis]|uniref:SAM-dependent methyltransferase n=1 Tax=Nocardioides marmoribigeumensis TaxID=433649 RepID=A0ABU2BZQ9_9ACTN|nr:methyltransferase domain-containing protein [Nocardioides marmoribigeumensis]MDR7363887.1 SAM-dependent methyltransferase [Nocardioides marmoribigeumensis]